MKNFTVTVDGVSYPCRVTVGACKLYKDATGANVPAVMDTDELLVFIACCAASGCKAEGKTFPYPVADIGHHLSPDDGAGFYNAWAEAHADEAPDTAPEEKKSR